MAGSWPASLLGFGASIFFFYVVGSYLGGWYISFLDPMGRLHIHRALKRSEWHKIAIKHDLPNDARLVYHYACLLRAKVFSWNDVEREWVGVWSRKGIGARGSMLYLKAHKVYDRVDGVIPMTVCEVLVPDTKLLPDIGEMIKAYYSKENQELQTLKGENKRLRDLYMGIVQTLGKHLLDRGHLSRADGSKAQRRTVAPIVLKLAQQVQSAKPFVAEEGDAWDDLRCFLKRPSSE